MEIEIQVTDTNYNLGQEFLISLATFSLNYLGIHPESELSISIVTNSEIEKLHQQWMGLPGPTDVLSFPMDELKPNSATDGPGILGDIMISPEFAQISATQNNKTLKSEIELLLVHGILHLLGYDHVELPDEKEMFALQELILEKWRNQ